MAVVLRIELPISADRCGRVCRANRQLLKDLLLQRAIGIDSKEIAILAVSVGNAIVVNRRRVDTPFEAVRVIAAGEALLAPTVTRRLLDRFARSLPDEKPPPSLEGLTTRELEILRLVAGGLSNAEIAEQLVVTEATVKTHVSSVLRKLHLRDRVQAVVLAYDAGLVQPAAPEPPG